MVKSIQIFYTGLLTDISNSAVTKFTIGRILIK